MAKFELGYTTVTVEVHKHVDIIGFDKKIFVEKLEDHSNGQWGEIHDKYKKANDLALENGGRVVSSFYAGDKEIWIVTESDRSVTVFMFPSQYSGVKGFNLEI